MVPGITQAVPFSLAQSPAPEFAAGFVLTAHKGAHVLAPDASTTTTPADASGNAGSMTSPVWPAPGGAPAAPGLPLATGTVPSSSPEPPAPAPEKVG
jgi:hypothetical protein